MVVDRTYSLTCYKLKFTERQKFSRNIDKDKIEEKEYYLADGKRFVNDFLEYLSNENYSKESDYFSIDNESWHKVDNNLEKLTIELDYGRDGREFKVLEKGTITNHGEDAKYICHYKFNFYVKNNNLYMCIVRMSNYGCKTAILNKMRQYLSDTNVIISDKIVGNSEFLKKQKENMSYVSLSYSSYIKKDTGDEYDSNKVSVLKTKTTLKLGNDSISTKLYKFIAKIQGAEITDLVDALEADYNSIKDSVIEKDSLRCEVNICGSKRIVRLNDLESLMYDLDITDMIKYDSNNRPIESSVQSLMDKYVIGIDEVLIDE